MRGDVGGDLSSLVLSCLLPTPGCDHFCLEAPFLGAIGGVKGCARSISNEIEVIVITKALLMFWGMLDIIFNLQRKTCTFISFQATDSLLIKLCDGNRRQNAKPVNRISHPPSLSQRDRNQSQQVYALNQREKDDIPPRYLGFIPLWHYRDFNTTGPQMVPRRTPVSR